MIASAEILEFLHNRGFSYASGVPCSYFSRLISELEKADYVRYIPATREDEAIGIASGIAFGGKLSFVLMQNSGFATIGDALTSLAQLYRLPMLLMISWRGLEADRDFPEHSIMGEVTEGTLTSYRIPYWELKQDNWQKIIQSAVDKMKETSRPVALLVKQEVL
ncbi:MAG: sulfopyruvate decarboxylase subunit alpha [Candidatus Thorarchaeota archaeon]|nr:sulfopyruvate decarboxylase subunit alpha [Candidatus Thorarchaeota archaeon]